MSGERKLLHITVTTERQTSKNTFEVDSVVVGRNADCTLPITHNDVSRKHLTLWIRDTEAWIEDLGSSNGTFVNGSKLLPHDPRQLLPSDQIMVGAKSGIVLRVELEIIGATVAEPLAIPYEPEEEEHGRAETVIFALPSQPAAVAVPVPGPAPVPQATPRAVPQARTPTSNPFPAPSRFPDSIYKQPATYEDPAPVAKSPATPAFQPGPGMRSTQEIESERLLQEAKKEAANIILMARLQAEHKVQEIYEKAETAQKEAQEFYRERMQEAYRAAEETYAEARGETESLFEKTRKSCDEIRLQAMNAAAELRANAKRECEDLARATEAQTRQMKEHRLQEGEAILARKEAALIEAANEKMDTIQREFDEKVRSEMEAHVTRISTESSAHERRLKSESENHALSLGNQLNEHSLRLKSELEAHTQRLAKESADHDLRLQDEKAAQSRRLQEELSKHEERLTKEIAAHADKIAAELKAHQERVERESGELEVRQQKEKDRFEAETAGLRQEHAHLTAEVRSFKSEKTMLESSLAQLKTTEKEAAAAVKKLEESNKAAESQKIALDADTKRMSTDLEKKKRDFEQLSGQYRDLADKKDQATRQVDSDLLSLKSKLEQNKEKMRKAEEEHLIHLKLETAKKVQQTEKELMSELSRKKDAFVKEILLSIEKSSTVIAEKVSDWRKETPQIEENLVELIEGELFAMKSEGSSAVKKIDLGARRRKERTLNMGLGAAMGIAVVVAGLQVWNQMQGPSPLQRAVAGEAEARKNDLAARKFNPPKVKELKDEYVDAVIYTDQFVEIYTSDDYQKKWAEAASKHLLKMWKVDEDSALQAVSITKALVTSLAERKEKLHPDYLKDGIQKMKDSEAEALKRIAGILGSSVRWESLKKYEKEFFTEYRSH